MHSANAKSNILLSWTHYKTLLQVPDEKARKWYEKESAQQTWSVRTLQRNIEIQQQEKNDNDESRGLIMLQSQLKYL